MRKSNNIYTSVILILLCCYLDISAQTSGKFTDSRDNISYKYVVIGKQTWMAQNLRYNTGNSICYMDSTSYCKMHGYLYTWEDALNACPPGWHLPSAAEWDTLISFLGGKWKAGGHLKEKGTNHWEWPNEGATDKYGFCAIPTDIKLQYGGYVGLLRANAEYWSSTEADGISSHSFKLYSSIVLADLTKASKTTAISIRCIKDTIQEKTVED
ncbi:MAG: fibrobacter succinogenes major paralogous domain-containing protein [Bacteroidales bacterium]|nr:fibrobacter succinogenes major paralogous domain-containing protein [Bacteroidales bacterium]